MTTTWPLATLPRVPEYWRATPTEPRPCLGSPVASSTRSPGGGLGAARARTRCASRAWSSHVASVKRCCKRAVEVPATAAAMVAQFWGGRSGRNPVRERVPLARLVARRKRDAKGAKETASSGSVPGLAFGTTGVFIWQKMTLRPLRGTPGKIKHRGGESGRHHSMQWHVRPPGGCANIVCVVAQVPHCVVVVAAQRKQGGA